MSRRGLGRGLDKLLGGAPVAVTTESTHERGQQQIAVDKLRPGGGQPRSRFDKDELQSLADSIRQQGVIQPLIVRPLKDGYAIVAGERRWRAAQIAGLKTVPVISRSLSDKEAMLFALVENIQRTDLNAVEQARGINRLVEELGLTHAAAADSVGMSRAAVTNLLRLLSLCPPVLQMLAVGKLDAGHARALLSLTAAQQQQAARLIVEKKLSVRAAEQLAKTFTTAKTAKSAADNADTRLLESELSAALSARVQIHHRRQGDGKLTIHYSSLAALDRVLAKLRK